MCELLIMKVTPSAHSTDDAITAMQYKTGMVITIQEDGYNWGEGDLSGHAHVLKLPGVAIESLMHLQSDHDPNINSNEHRQIRMWIAKDLEILKGAKVSPGEEDAFLSQYFSRVVPIIRKNVIG
jgi:hypothetical protein